MGINLLLWGLFGVVLAAGWSESKHSYAVMILATVLLGVLAIYGVSQ